MQACGHLTASPTLRQFFTWPPFLDEIITPSQLAILEESFRSRRLSGHPPLRTVCLTVRFSDLIDSDFTDWQAEELCDFAELLQRMCAVVKSESPTTELMTEDGDMSKLVQDCLDLAASRSQSSEGEEAD